VAVAEVERSGWTARVTAGDVGVAVPAVMLELVVEADQCIRSNTS
jgi:hypothetical protein